jgi:hypothetical protein
MLLTEVFIIMIIPNYSNMCLKLVETLLMHCIITPLDATCLGIKIIIGKWAVAPIAVSVLLRRFK